MLSKMFGDPASVKGLLGDYKGGGYITDLPTDGASFDLVVRGLKRSHWLDQHSRALVVTTNVYNPTSDFLAVVTAILEFTPGGGVLPSFR